MIGNMRFSITAPVELVACQAVEIVASDVEIGRPAEWRAVFCRPPGPLGGDRKNTERRRGGGLLPFSSAAGIYPLREGFSP
jgi:hypothetical protein